MAQLGDLFAKLGSFVAFFRAASSMLPRQGEQCVIWQQIADHKLNLTKKGPEQVSPGCVANAAMLVGLHQLPPCDRALLFHESLTGSLRA